MSLRAWLTISLILLTASANAVEIPTGLSQSDRIEVARMLGVTTTNKLLSNPYPLGGYSGFEVGVSVEFIDMDNLSRLGAGTGVQDDFVLPRLTLAKGLYNNTDIGVYFSPNSANSGTHSYGGSLRLGFYEAKFIPMTMSLLTHANVLNSSDVYSSFSVGGDLIVGVNTSRLALYFGFGQVQNRSHFLATGTRAITSSPSGSDQVEESVSQNHTFVGVHVDLFGLFLAAQLDRFADSVYSAKLGTRF